jgi:hypothetical protein
MRLIIFIVLVLMVNVHFVDAGETTLRSIWTSPNYCAKPFPDEWRPKLCPSTVREMVAFMDFDLKSAGVSIPNFVACFGSPDRYLVARQNNGQNFLIYDFPTGQSLALYVHEPPDNKFSAIVIVDSAGNLVRLIK